MSNYFSLIGYLLSEIGLGHTARNIAYSFKSAGLPVNFINIPIDGRSSINEFSGLCSSYAPNNINFVVLDLLSTGILFSNIKKLGLGSKNYLYLFWELERFHYSKISDVNCYDEIIAPSNFIANTLKNFTNKEIRLIPHPIKIPCSASNEINNSLRFFSHLDFDSFVARKNPLAVLDVFKAAFPHHYDDVELILKVRGHNDRGTRNSIHHYCTNDPRIKVIDQTLNQNDMDKLINSCNVYLSMHRAEGFGLGPAEALALEKIVVSTNYGGTCDFISTNTGYPVDFKLIPVKPYEYPFWENQLWAEPNIDSAVSALLDIYHNFDNALLRAKRGRQLMIDKHSFIKVGNLLKTLA